MQNYSFGARVFTCICAAENQSYNSAFLFFWSEWGPYAYFCSVISDSVYFWHINQLLVVTIISKDWN